jgi:murein DD-endopeptidase MepM/ murein hydrolase activator NlpD
MTWTIRRAAFSAALGAAALSAALCSTAYAAMPEEERVLGSDCEDAQLKSYLPFTRSIGTSGVIKGSLADSTAAAGVPPAAMLEALNAFATAIDLERDLKDGDRFYVRYERAFTIEGNPTGVGRVLWAELRTQAKGTLAIHRFRPGKTDAEAFWFANGQGTQPAQIQMPLRNISVTSGFGLRADPFDQPWARSVPMGPVVGPGPSAAGPLMPGAFPSANWKPKTTQVQPQVQPKPQAAAQAQGQPKSPLVNPMINPSPLGGAAESVNKPTALGIAMGLSPTPVRSFGGFKQGGGSGGLFMHEGVDLVASPGTPIMAAADGIVVGAEPKGRYGNWIEIAHEGKLATVYGHLSAFAPGIAPGVRVEQGDVIGFTGSTGRTTGPHLHFEILVNGRPTNPIAHAATKHGLLRGPELVRFRKVVERDVAEREREAKAM